MLRYDFYIGRNFPSNGTIANVLLRGFDLIFQGQIFQMQIPLKWLAKHGHWTAPFVVLCDVSLLFQGQIFEMLIYRKRCMLRKYVKYDFYRRWYLSSKLNHCENHTLRSGLAISWSKLQIFTRLFQQICLHLHGTYRRVALDGTTVWLIWFYKLLS